MHLENLSRNCMKKKIAPIEKEERISITIDIEWLWDNRVVDKKKGGNWNCFKWGVYTFLSVKKVKLILNVLSSSAYYKYSTSLVLVCLNTWKRLQLFRLSVRNENMLRKIETKKDFSSQNKKKIAQISWTQNDINDKRTRRRRKLTGKCSGQLIGDVCLNGYRHRYRNSCK